ncbi:chemotaxis protein CheB [Rhizobium sp. S163]|uniref:chemotaxis protein CheB n=1 Tax=Rhizobium sp. S163 TaxID=3055039 RepID=UPI0025A96413|nr:chemotaxis protein CheB [Rhizobium sp. S163]MDM9644799.1 chemotaxis protein CheB [Rhizobium sp. S163]
MTLLRPEVVVIGASAGALDALGTILPALPSDFATPIIVVVHVPPDKPSVLAELFAARCALGVREAEDKEPLTKGVVYFAPPDYHLLVESDRTLSLSTEAPVLFSRPSIDVLFESASDAFGPGVVALVLTGANEDGARGLKAVADAGGKTIVQQPETAFASAMPEAALGACPDAVVMELGEMAAYLRRF